MRHGFVRGEGLERQRETVNGKQTERKLKPRREGNGVSRSGEGNWVIVITIEENKGE